MALKNFIRHFIQTTRNFLNSLFNSSGGKNFRRSKNIPSTNELLKELEAKEKEPVTPPPPTEEKEFVWEIRSQEDWNKYKIKLQNLDKLKNFSAEHSENFKWFKIDKFENDLNNFQPEEFDEYTTGKVVTETVKIFKRLMVALDSCDREIKNPKKNSAEAENLKNLIEEYLQKVGVKTMNFKSGDDYDDWADLGMDVNVLTENTEDENKHNKLKEIYVQPHFLYFADEHGQKEKRIFGGSCAVYVFEK